MRNSIFLLIFICSLISCNSQEETRAIIKSKDSSFRTVERFFPAAKTTETFDTVIANGQIQITITKTNLDSYIAREYKEDSSKQIDKYRDASISVIIKQQSKTLLDTVFVKQQFANYADNGFMDIAIFHNYWFNKIDKDKIELFGVICEPETDYALDFYHYFDLKSKKLTFIELRDEEGIIDQQ